MAITGLIMVGFLLFHMYGNTKIFMSRDAFNEYSHHLREFLVPIFPHEGFLWCFRFFMLAAIALHVWSAITLWKRAKRSVGVKRYQRSGFKSGGYVSFLMRWGGVMIILFLIFHILTFTTQTMTVGYSGSTDPASRFIFGFQQWWLVALYAVAIGFVCMHVWRGFWSAFATLGANTSKESEKILNILAAVIAGMIYLGFMAAPVAVLLGVIK